MKKICRTLKLRKYKTELMEKMNLKSIDYMVIFTDGTWQYCIGEDEVYSLLAKDHIKSIRYIFDMNDRIIVERNILIDTDIIK